MQFKYEEINLARKSSVRTQIQTPAQIKSQSLTIRTEILRLKTLSTNRAYFHAKDEIYRDIALLEEHLIHLKDQLSRSIITEHYKTSENPYNGPGGLSVLFSPAASVRWLARDDKNLSYKEWCEVDNNEEPQSPASLSLG